MCSFDYEIYGELSGDLSEGLALWRADVVFTTNGLPTDVGPPLEAGLGMGSFVKPEGMTNPAGYGGTVSGNTLLQVGGGQNTISNHSSVAPYPLGTVDTGIAVSGPTLLATGTYTTTPYQEGEILRIGLANCSASVILAGETGPVWEVTTVATDCLSALLELLVGYHHHACFYADVNCDGVVNGLDIGEITSPANWFQTCEAAADPRADVNLDGVVNGLDIGEVTSPANWFTSGHFTPPYCPCDGFCP